jgi:hypothetical protein
MARGAACGGAATAQHGTARAAVVGRLRQWSCVVSAAAAERAGVRLRIGSARSACCCSGGVHAAAAVLLLRVRARRRPCSWRRRSCWQLRGSSLVRAGLRLRAQGAWLLRHEACCDGRRRCACQHGGSLLSASCFAVCGSALDGAAARCSPTGATGCAGAARFRGPAAACAVAAGRAGRAAMRFWRGVQAGLTGWTRCRARTGAEGARAQVC